MLLYISTRNICQNVHLAKAQDIESFVGQPHFFGVIDVVNGNHTLGNKVVQLGVWLDEKLLCFRNVFRFVVVNKVRIECRLTVVVGESAREQLIENVVVSLSRLLKRNSRLFEQVRLDIGTGDFASRAEVNTDEFTLDRRNFNSQIFVQITRKFTQ